MVNQDDHKRPGDVAWLHHRGPGQHLLIDVSITTTSRAAILDYAHIPGFAARAQERAKFSKYAPLLQEGCYLHRHRFVPFVLEDGGRLGEHARALLVELALHAAHTGHCLEDRTGRKRPSWLVSKWMEQISTTFHRTSATQIRTGLGLDDTYGPTTLGR